MIVNADGTIRLERRAPFAYLKELTDEMREVSSRLEGNGRGTKTDSLTTVRCVLERLDHIRTSVSF